MDPSPPPRSDAPPDPSDPDRPDVAEPVVPPDGTDGDQELIGTDGDRELIGADDDRHSRHDLALIASWVVVALTCIFVFASLSPRGILSTSTPTGGDMGAHVWG
ncbi:MAG TPA: hypothetical protein PLZ72_13245, partial [Microthrixaceae bacterium]|nr:hypothetical protein [Microthrixaceae bacterium]